MHTTKAAVALAATVAVLSFGWFVFAPDGGKAGPAPDDYALDLVTHTGQYWDDATVLGEAEDQLVTGCMAEAGFRFPLDRPAAAGPGKLGPSELGPVAAGPLHGEVSGTDLAYRRRHGYGIVDAAAPAQPQPPPPVPPAGYDDALSGRATIDMSFGAGPTITVASGGCRGRARATLAGSAERWAVASYAADYLNDDLIRAVADDPAIAGAALAWRGCMAAAGHPAADYREPRNLIERRLSESGATSAVAAAEREIATADGQCRLRARVVETGLARRRDHVRRMPAAWRATLVRAADLRRTAVARARLRSAA